MTPTLYYTGGRVDTSRIAMLTAIVALHGGCGEVVDSAHPQRDAAPDPTIPGDAGLVAPSGRDAAATDAATTRDGSSAPGCVPIDSVWHRLSLAEACANFPPCPETWAEAYAFGVTECLGQASFVQASQAGQYAIVALDSKVLVYDPKTGELVGMSSLIGEPIAGCPPDAFSGLPYFYVAGVDFQTDDGASFCDLCTLPPANSYQPPTPECASSRLSCRADSCPGTCGDGIQNGSETDVDCGGGRFCGYCETGQGCDEASNLGVAPSRDCASGVCTGGICMPPRCSDGVENGDEVGVDCGGACDGCSLGQACGADADCAIGLACLPVVLDESTCQAPFEPQ